MPGMVSSLTPAQLSELAAKQVNVLFPDLFPVSPSELMESAKRALKRLEFCFSHVNNRYFFNGKTTIFDHCHNDQYAMWLYCLSNEHYLKTGDRNVCSKLFSLNKTLHGCDIYYELSLPSIFLLVHPLGTVLGRGNYEDYLMVYQRCGIGSNHDVYPTLGRILTLHPGSSILGKSIVGDNCVIAADSLVIDKNIGDNQIYFGKPNEFKMRVNDRKESIWRIQH